MSPFVRSSEGIKIQKKLWEETQELLRQHVPADELDQLL